jgi:hypothetical protein
LLLSWWLLNQRRDFILERLLTHVYTRILGKVVIEKLDFLAHVVTDGIEAPDVRDFIWVVGNPLRISPYWDVDGVECVFGIVLVLAPLDFGSRRDRHHFAAHLCQGRVGKVWWR